MVRNLIQCFQLLKHQTLPPIRQTKQSGTYLELMDQNEDRHHMWGGRRGRVYGNYHALGSAEEGCAMNHSNHEDDVNKSRGNGHKNKLLPVFVFLQFLSILPQSIYIKTTPCVSLEWGASAYTSVWLTPTSPICLTVEVFHHRFLLLLHCFVDEGTFVQNASVFSVFKPVNHPSLQKVRWHVLKVIIINNIFHLSHIPDSLINRYTPSFFFSNWDQSYVLSPVQLFW